MPEIRFYGATGSIPAPLQQDELNDILKSFWSHCKKNDYQKPEEAIENFADGKIVSGNSSCVQIEYDMAPLIVCDAGTGIRKLGKEMVGKIVRNKEIYLFMSHTHWDHVIGFPFFAPLYDSNYNVNIMGCHKGLEKRFTHMLSDTHFPVQLSDMAANIKFIQLEEGKSYSLNNVKVTPIKLDHPGDSYAYKFNNGMKSVIYSTDSNYSCFENDPEHSKALDDTNMLIFDGMFSFKEYIDKVHYGHSTPFIGVDLAVKHKIQKLVLFHHNPDYNQRQIYQLLEDAKDYKNKHYRENELSIHLAIEGDRIIF
jgi:phosphoribosyl 1,2-cyclic phosphodiesterase